MVSPFSMLFFFTFVLGLVLCMSSDTWFGAWVGLELNLLSFIPLISSSSNRYSLESILKYFLVQVLASIMIIFSALFILMMVNLKMVFSLSLLLKCSRWVTMTWLKYVDMCWPDHTLEGEGTTTFRSVLDHSQVDCAQSTWE